MCLSDQLLCRQGQLNVLEQILFLVNLNVKVDPNEIKMLDLKRQEIMTDIVQLCAHCEEECWNRCLRGHFPESTTTAAFLKREFDVELDEHRDLALSSWQSLLLRGASSLPDVNVLYLTTPQWSSSALFLAWLTRADTATEITHLHLPSLCESLTWFQFQQWCPLWLKCQKSLLLVNMLTLEPVHHRRHYDFLRCLVELLPASLQCVVLCPSSHDISLSPVISLDNPLFQFTVSQVEAIVMSGRARYHHNILTTINAKESKDIYQSLLSWQSGEPASQSVMDMRWATVLRKTVSRLSVSLDKLWFAWHAFLLETDELAQLSDSCVFVSQILLFYMTWSNPSSTVHETKNREKTLAADGLISLSIQQLPLTFILHLIQEQHQMQTRLIHSTKPVSPSWCVICKPEGDAQVFLKSKLFPVCFLRDRTQRMQSVQIYLELVSVCGLCKSYSENRQALVTKVPVTLLAEFECGPHALFVQARLPSWQRFFSLHDIVAHSIQSWTALRPLDHDGSRRLLAPCAWSLEDTVRAIFEQKFPSVSKESTSTSEWSMFRFSSIRQLEAKFPIVAKYVHPWIRSSDLLVQDKEKERSKIYRCRDTSLDPQLFHDLVMQ